MTRYIYARVSTQDQNVDQQVAEISKSFTADEIVTEKASGKTLDRPLFEEMRAKLVKGDSVAVYDISRLGRNTTAVLEFGEECKEKGITVFVLSLGNIDITSSTGTMVLTVLSGVAQMQRAEMLEKQRIGIERAKSENRYTGRRQSSETVKKLDEAIRLIEDNGLTKDQAAKAAGVGIATLYRHLKNKQQPSNE